MSEGVQTELAFERVATCLERLRAVLQKPRPAKVALHLARLIAQRGEADTINQMQCSRLTMSRVLLAKELTCAQNSIAKAVKRLGVKKGLGVLGVVPSSPATYVIAWDLVEKLELPSEPSLEEMGLFARPPDTGRTPGGHRRPCVFERKSSNSSDRVFERTSSVQASTAASGVRVRFDRLTDEDVRRADVEAIRAYYREAVRMGWWLNDHEWARKFLAIWYHAAHADSEKYNAAALVVSRVKGKNWRRLAEQAWEWSSNVMRASAGHTTRKQRLETARRERERVEV